MATTRPSLTHRQDLVIGIARFSFSPSYCLSRRITVAGAALVEEMTDPFAKHVLGSEQSRKPGLTRLDGAGNRRKGGLPVCIRETKIREIE